MTDNIYKLLSIFSQFLIFILGFPLNTAYAEAEFRFAGFGTLGYTIDDSSQINPYRYINTSSHAASTTKTQGTWLLDSRLGAQLAYLPNNYLDFVTQWVLRDQTNDNMMNMTELAYAKFRPQPQVDLSLGRIQYDVFLLSDHRNVGYAYPWVRPPVEFYTWMPIFSIDGAEAAYRLYDSNGFWRLKAQIGHTKTDISMGRTIYHFLAHDLYDISLIRQTNYWRFKLAYSKFSVASEVPNFPPLLTTLDTVAAKNLPGISEEAADLRRNIAFLNAKISYSTFGIYYNDTLWQIQTEIGKATASAEAIPSGTMGYLSVGRYFNHWMPFIMIASARAPNDIRTPQFNWGDKFNQSLRDPATYLINSTRFDQDTYSLGVRWDLKSRYALKLQWNHSIIQKYGYGLLARDSSLLNQSNNFNEIALTFDFIF